MSLTSTLERPEVLVKRKLVGDDGWTYAGLPGALLAAITASAYVRRRT